jgi:hypothetical protein
MARLTGDIMFTGTIEGLCFYKMYGSCFVRTKSSLTGKRFWKDKAFEGSRKSCNQLARASALASLFYKAYPEAKRRKGLFNEMTGRVKLWLKEEKTEEETMLLLRETYPVPGAEKKQVKKTKRFSTRKKERLFIVCLKKDMISHGEKHEIKRFCCLKE